MAWRISGTYYAPCSCNVGCPCVLGEMEGDQEGGWCSGVVAIDIQSGDADGVDLGGAKAVLIADWPKGFLAGDGTGRLYFDEGVSDEQRSALESILWGDQGGAFEDIAQLVPERLESKVAPIAFDRDGDRTRVSVGDIGEAVVESLKGPTGESTRLLHGAAAFRDDILLGNARGTRFHDPDLREWESLGHGEFSEVEWSG